MDSMPQLFAILPLLALMPITSAAPLSQVELATNLEAVRGSATAGSGAGTPDGKYFFFTQAATMVVIEPGSSVGTPRHNFDFSKKEFPLGDFGIHFSLRPRWPLGAVTLTNRGAISDIQEPVTLHLRKVSSSGERLLYVCDHRQALRIYSSL